MIHFPTLIIIIGIYVVYTYYVRPYLLQKPEEKSDDKGEFIDYEEVD